MLRLRVPEVTDGFDLCHNFAGPDTRCLDVRDGIQRDGLLICIDVVNGRTIAHPTVVTLTVQCGRIMDLKEEFQQVAVCRLGIIKGNLKFNEPSWDLLKSVILL